MHRPELSRQKDVDRTALDRPAEIVVAARSLGASFRSACRHHRLQTSMPKPALVLTGITKRFAKGPERHGISWKLKKLAHVAGLGPEPEPTNGRAVVDSVNLTLGSGEIAILVGAPGCGKTSLLKIAAGLMRPTAGVLRVEGGSESLIYPKAGWHTSLDRSRQSRSPRPCAGVCTSPRHGGDANALRASQRSMARSIVPFGNTRTPCSRGWHSG